MTVDARAALLARIRAELGPEAIASVADVSARWHMLPRSYDQTVSRTLDEKLQLFEDRLRDYDAELTRVTDDEVASTIARILFARGDRPTLVPPGFPERWRPDAAALLEDAGFSNRELDRFDGVVTAVSVAIAETGTLILQNVPGQGRRAATLVPDFHLCVVTAASVVMTVPEAFVRLANTATLPTTFISGPSATADIEMTRIKGVHGPRFLHVLLVVGGDL